MAVLVLLSTTADTVCGRGGLPIPEKRKRDPVDVGMRRDKRALTLALFQQQTTARRIAMFIPLDKLGCDDGVLIRIIIVLYSTVYD
jgi:hypothetical protein